MKNLFLISLILIGFHSVAQTFRYNPSKAGTTSNMPYAPAQASPTDARTYLYDSANFRWRPYISTAEVLNYLYLPKYRVGQFPIIINTGGVLSNGQIIGGTNAEWWFKDCYEDGCLILKKDTSSGGSPNTSIGSGYKVAVDGTNEVKTLTPGYGQLIDSSDSEVSLSLDSATVFEDIRATIPSAATNLDSSRNGTQFSIISSNGTPAVILSADTTRSGAYPANDKKKVNRLVPFSNYEELRLTDNVTDDTTVIYINSQEDQFRYDPLDITTSDDSAMTIVNGTKRLKRIWFDKIEGRWFGLKGDNSTDNSYNMQKAINYAFANMVNPWLKLDNGIFIANNIVIARDDDNNGAYNFHSFTLEGAVASYAMGLSGTTVIRVDNNDAAGIHIQSGRNVVIKNLVLQGNAPSLNTFAEVVNGTDADYLGPVRNNPFSPEAAIVIDPFHSSVPSINRYPNMDQWYFASSTGGSSMIKMENVSIYNFAVGIMISPNGATQNCDNIIFSGGNISKCRSAWASGQNQSRANVFENTYTLGGIKYLINCSEYGDGQGSAPSVYNLNVAGGTKYLYLLNGPFEGVSFNNIYAESIWSLGKSGNKVVNFNGGHISLDYSNSLVKKPTILAQGDIVNFNGVDIGYFDQANRGLPFNIRNLYFNGYSFFNTPTINGVAGGSNITSYNPVHESLMPQGNFNGRIFRNQDTYYNVSGDVTHTSISQSIDPVFTETKQFVVNDADATAYFLSSNVSRYRVGDFLATTTSMDDPTDIYDAYQSSLGNIYEISSDTVKVRNFASGLAPLTNYDIDIIHTPVFITHTIGDLTTGSDTIRNVKYLNASFRVGDFIKSATGIAVGTRVVYVDLANGLIALSQNATANVTKAELYDALTVMEAKGNIAVGGARYNGQVFFKGDIIKNTLTLQDSVAYWVCTSPGAYNTATPPTFREVLTKDHNIYTIDGTISSNRSVNMNGRTLNFYGGKLGLNATVPSQRLHVNGQIQVDTVTTGTSSDSVIVVNNGLLKKVLQSSIGGINIYNTNGSLTSNRTVTMSSNTLGFVGGYVGVNTSLPEYMLHVKGQTKIDTVTTGTGTDSVLVINNGLIKKVLQSSIGGSATTLYNGNSTLTSDRTVSFGAFNLNFDGNTGFGTTPAARLHAMSTTQQLRIGYDATNYLSFTTGSTGTTTITPNGTSATILFGSIGTESSTLFVPSTFGGGTASSPQYNLAGASVGLRFGIRGSGSQTVNVNSSYGTMIIGNMTVNEQTSGTHPLIANFAVKPLTISNNGATLTDAATLYVEGAATATASGFNDAFRVAAGSSRFGGDAIVNGTTYLNGAAFAGAGLMVQGPLHYGITRASDNSFGFDGSNRNPLVVLPIITANRTISLPVLSGILDGQTAIFKNENSAGFTWSFTPDVIDKAGVTISVIPNGETWYLYFDDNLNVWKILFKY